MAAPCGGSGRTRAAVVALAVVGLEMAWLRFRGYRRPGRVVVRCRSGHLFTMLWIPGVSVTALRLGPWRVQRCPVGRHWSAVSLVRASSLSEAELAGARRARATASQATASQATTSQANATAEVVG